MKRTKVWTTKEGEKIRVCDMETSHLRNCIRHIERRAKVHMMRADTAAIQLTRAFGQNPHTIASDMLDQLLDEQADMTTEDYYPEIYYDMVDEMEERSSGQEN